MAAAQIGSGKTVIKYYINWLLLFNYEFIIVKTENDFKEICI